MQRSLAAFLVAVSSFVGLGSLAVFVALSIAGCGSGSRYDDMTGEEIYGHLCAQCHGPEGRAPGGRANSYVGKRDLWDEAKLLEFIRNPAAYKKKAPHLTKRYMPAISTTISQEARERLVAHVLKQMEALEPGERR